MLFRSRTGALQPGTRDVSGSIRPRPPSLHTTAVTSHYRRHFNLHLSPLFNQRCHVHTAHGRKVAAHHCAVDSAQLLETGNVLGAVQDVPGHAGDVLRACAGLGQHGDDIAKRLGGLQDEVVALKLLLGVPADLAADKYLGAMGGNAMRALPNCVGLGEGAVVCKR